MNYVKVFADAMKEAGTNINAYFWRLSGDEPNSLGTFLGLDENQLKIVLRVCKVYTGDSDNVSKKNFEMLMSQTGFDHTTYRLTTTKETSRVELREEVLLQTLLH